MTTPFISAAKRERICRGELSKANKDEQEMFIEACERLKLDPESRQIYPIFRWSKDKQREVMGLVTTIDGFRLVAERSGQYAGQDGPFFCGEDGVWKDVWTAKKPPVAAKVGILRHDFKQPVYAVALWSSYYEGTKNPIATKMPDVMLAKCAESLGLRKAFPYDLSGIYTSEEMEQAGVTPPEPAAPPKAQVESFANDEWIGMEGKRISSVTATGIQTALQAKGLAWERVRKEFQAEFGRLLPKNPDDTNEDALKQLRQLIGSYPNATPVSPDDTELTPEEREKVEAMRGFGNVVVQKPGKRGDK